MHCYKNYETTNVNLKPKITFVKAWGKLVFVRSLQERMGHRQQNALNALVQL